MSAATGSNGALIDLHNVSKRFRIHRERQRSIQESFIRLFQRRRRSEEYFWPLRSVSFSVGRGDSIGILGPNGSGKSTLLKLIAGILEPTSGTIAVRGQIASLLELGAGFHLDLTGRENIFLNGSVYGLTRRQMQSRVESIIDFAELGDFIDTPVKHYSSGMYVRLGFAVAIHTDPDVLVVDEVLTVGDQMFQQKCLERIYALKRRGVAIVLVSHNLSDVERLCDRAVWLSEGCIHADGPAAQIVDQYLAYSNDLYYQGRQAKGAAELEAEERRRRIDDPERRWGTMQAELTRVELLDAQGITPRHFESGQPLRLRLTYHAYERIERPAFGLAFYRRDGIHVNGPNSVMEGFEIPWIEGGGAVEYRIDALPLNPGHFELTAAIYNTNSTIAIDHHHRMYEFEVRSPTLRHEEGVVHIAARWAHTAIPSAPAESDVHVASVR